MKKLISIFTSLLALVLVLTACSSKSDTKSEKKENVTVKVASHTAPMTDMLEMIKDDLQKEGYNLEIVKVSDNVQANVALNNKEVDANFFQHKPFMEQFNQKNGAHLVAVQPIYNATVAFYSKNIKDIKELKDGADVAIPSDPTNLARALRLLDKNKVITLKDPNSYTVTTADIKENPKKTLGIYTTMVVKTLVFSGYKRIDKVRGEVFVLYTRTVEDKKLTYTNVVIVVDKAGFSLAQFLQYVWDS